MPRFFYIGLLAYLLGLQAWAQAPAIITPADGATGIAINDAAIVVRSTSTGNDPGDPETINVEVSRFSNFSLVIWSSNDIVREDDIATDYPLTLSGVTLLSSTQYYIRAVSDKWGNGVANEFTTAVSPVTASNRLQSINGITAQTVPVTPPYPASTVRPNARRLIFELNQSLANASEYVIQWDTVSPAFTNICDSIIVPGTTGTIRIDQGGIRGIRLSGNTNVFVRSRGINSGSRGPWGSVRRFCWPLQPCSLIAPGATINRFAFKLWTRGVPRADRYYWQVDDDPTFSSPHTLTGAAAGLNRTVAGITGNVFQDNYTVGTNPGGRAFDFLQQLTFTTYHVRVRAWNSIQNGYWADTFSVTPNPILTAGFLEPTNLQTGLLPTVIFRFRDDPNFTESTRDFQVATDAGFTNLVVDQAGVAAANAPVFVPNLLYNTTYYARVRTTAPPFTSSWVSVQFTTRAEPAPVVTYPTPNIVWSTTGIWCYASFESSITRYDWEVEKTNAPTGTFSGTSTFYGRNFGTFLVRGGEYRIRVRGFAGAQSITGPWSAWVPFRITPPALPAVGDNAAARASALLAQSKEGQAQAYPNPFSGKVALELPQAATAFSVHDLSGRVVEAEQPARPWQQLGETWPAGVYFIRVRSAEGSLRPLRVVKE